MPLPRMLPKPKRRDNRIRSQAHRTWVAKHRCCVPGCNATYCVASHVKVGVPQRDCAGQSLKSGDNWVWSLCDPHHEEYDAGQEKFCTRYRIDALTLAAEFWQRSPHRRAAEGRRG